MLNLATDLFGSAEKLLDLLRSTQFMRQFGHFRVDIEHCRATADVATHYLESSAPSLSSSKTRNLVGLLSLSHHLLDWWSRPPHPVTRDPYGVAFWSILELHRLIVVKYYIQYSQWLGLRSETEVVDVFVPLEGEEDYIKLIESAIKRNLKDDFSLVLILHLLILADLTTALSSLPQDATSRTAHKAAQSAARYALHVLSPVLGAHKFGQLSTDLRDNAFRLLDPKAFENTCSARKDGDPTATEQMEVRRSLASILSRYLTRENIEWELLSRRKGALSSFRKASNYSVPVSSLWDLFAFRVVIENGNTEHCYLVLDRIRQDFRQWPDKKGFADYIANPKANGYKSIHIIIEANQGSLIEVQIRTRDMNSVAEFGSASHQAYKHPGISQAASLSKAARRGREHLIRFLKAHGLSLNDYVAHLGRHHRLDTIGIEHYFERIESGKYSLNENLIDEIREGK